MVQKKVLCTAPAFFSVNLRFLQNEKGNKIKREGNDKQAHNFPLGLKQKGRHRENTSNISAY
jgi:hypothetical protein